MQVLKNGTVTAQIRLTADEAIALILAEAKRNGEKVEMPDFGEGEADAVRIEFRYNESNAVRATLGTDEDLVLVLVDAEADVPA